MQHPLLTVSQSDALIQVVDRNSHIKWRTVQIQSTWLLKKTFRSQLIWIYTVSKGRVYAGSAEQGLRYYDCGQHTL